MPVKESLHLEADLESSHSMQISLEAIRSGEAGLTEQEVKINAKAGREACIETIGRIFFENHREDSVFSHDNELYDERGIYCFLGIDTREYSYEGLRLDANMDDWEYYASCFSLDGKITMYKCRVPKET